MPDFNYNAAGRDGKIQRGILSANDKNDLISQLEQAGLFLVSSSLVETEIKSAHEPALDRTPAPSVSEALPEKKSYSTELSPPLTKRQYLYLGAVLFAGILTGLLRVYPRYHQVDETTVLNQKMLLLAQAMQSPKLNRKMVEEIFTREYPGSQDSSITWYYVPPHIVVEIQYELKNGLKDPTNRFLRIVESKRT